MREDNNFYTLPQPDEISIREREDAMGAYLMMFAAIGAGLPLPVINLIAAIIYYFMNRHKSLFVRFHVLQSLLSQIPTSLINAIAVFWGVRILFFGVEFTDLYKGYLVLVALANLVYFIFSIIAAVKARRGKFYYFIFFGKYAYLKTFRVSDKQKAPVVNLPPKI
ncbi:DUF4870 domain-containing protein [Bacteroidota bacterium]